MLPLQSNSYVEATSVSADFVVIDTSAMLDNEAANVKNKPDSQQQQKQLSR